MTIENGVTADALNTTWHKSAHSGKQGNCVEVARLHTGQVAIRNSRYPSGPALIFTRPEMESFLLGAADGEFNYLTESD